MKDTDTVNTYRYAAQRSHTALARAAMAQLCARDLSCIAIEADQLKSHLGLIRLKEARAFWLLEDVKQLFRFAFMSETDTLYLSVENIAGHANAFPSRDPGCKALEACGVSAGWFEASPITTAPRSRRRSRRASAKKALAKELRVLESLQFFTPSKM